MLGEFAERSTAAGASTAGSGENAGASGGSPAGGETTDDTSSTTPPLNQPATADNVVDEPERADTPASGEGVEASADVSEGGSNAGGADDTPTIEAPPVLQSTPDPSAQLAPVNDNSPTEALPATGTD